MTNPHDPRFATARIKGRGTATRPEPRYLEQARFAFDDGWAMEEEPPRRPATVVTEETVKSLINYNQSPDLPFDRSINPYRGCEHGCAYCYARPAHAYVDLSPGLDFETRLFAKVNAAEVLQRELARPAYRCAPVALGANTDAYQPLEKKRGITREILEVLSECGHPVTIVTKSALVERDLDLLAPMASRGLAEVHVSVTTLDRSLARTLEPRAAAPERRLKTIAALADAGVPVGVMFAPVIPALNDHELEPVLARAAENGASMSGYVLLRLPHEIKQIFRDWLQQHRPLRAAHVMNQLASMRAGRDNDTAFHRRQVGTGVFAELLVQRFTKACRRHGFNRERAQLDASQFQPPAAHREQLQLF